MIRKEGNAEYCAEVLKVLADETRLAVVRQLLAKPKQVNEINAHLPISQSLLSHHLRILRNAGLVKARRTGKAVLYELSPGIRFHRSKSVIDLGCCQLAFASSKKEYHA